MSALTWNENLALGVPAMDATHQEFVLLSNELSTAPESERGSVLERFIGHTIAHFAQEDRWMEELEFPAMDCHRNEHRRVLEVLNTVKLKWLEGSEEGRRLLEQLLSELGPWFEQHAQTMDAALAWYMEQVGYVAERNQLVAESTSGQ